MYSFPDTTIVGCTMAFREGELIRYTLDDLLRYCTKIVVLLDNYDEKTEKVVLSYKERFPDRFIIEDSTFPRLSAEAEKEKGRLKIRLNHNQDKIREQVLRRLEILYKEELKFDILLWPDGDEVFTDFFPDVLREFIASDKKVMYIRPVTVFDDFTLVRDRTLVPHARVYKYRPDMTAIPYRSRTFYHPFKSKDVVKRHYVMVHLPLLTREYRKFRKHYVGRDSDDSLGYALYRMPKDVRKMPQAEISATLSARRNNPDYTVKEYLIEKYGDDETS